MICNESRIDYRTAIEENIGVEYEKNHYDRNLGKLERRNRKKLIENLENL